MIGRPALHKLEAVVDAGEETYSLIIDGQKKHFNSRGDLLEEGKRVERGCWESADDFHLGDKEKFGYIMLNLVEEDIVDFDYEHYEELEQLFFVDVIKDERSKEHTSYMFQFGMDPVGEDFKEEAMRRWDGDTNYATNEWLKKCSNKFEGPNLDN